MADDFKEIANDEFRKGDYKLALEYYEYVRLFSDDAYKLGRGLFLLSGVQSLLEEVGDEG